MNATTTAASRSASPAVGTTVQYTSKAGNSKPYTVASLGWVVLNGAGQPFTLSDAQCPAGTKVGDRVPYTTKGGKALLCPVTERAVFLRTANSSGHPFGVGVSRVVLPAAVSAPAVQPSAAQTVAPTAVPTPAAKPAPAAPKPVAAPDTHKAAFGVAAAHVSRAVVALRAIGLTPENGDTGRLLADLERIGGVLADRAATPKAAPKPPAVPQAVIDAGKAEQAAAVAHVAQQVAKAVMQQAAQHAVPLPAVQPAAAQTVKPAAVPTPAAKPLDVTAVVKAALVAQTLASLTGAVKAAGLTCDTTDSGKMAKALTAWLTPKAAAPATPAATQSTGDALAEYRRLQAACKTAGLSAKGTKVELTARLAAHKPAAAKTAPATAVHTGVPTLFVLDGKGGYRPATEGEVWAALDAMSKAGK